MGPHPGRFEHIAKRVYSEKHPGNGGHTCLHKCSVKLCARTQGHTSHGQNSKVILQVEARLWEGFLNQSKGLQCRKQYNEVFGSVLEPQELPVIKSQEAFYIICLKCMLYAECSANISRAMSFYNHVTPELESAGCFVVLMAPSFALSLSALTFLFPLKEVDMVLVSRGKQRATRIHCLHSVLKRHIGKWTLC